MTSEATYFIKITDHINKSDRIINRPTNLNTYTSDFNILINHLSKNNTTDFSNISNGKAELSKTETQIVPGYLYNSTKNVTTLVYTLSLIKADNQLSELFLSNFNHESTQTNNTENTNDIQENKETQSEQSNQQQNTSSQTNENVVNQCEQQYKHTEFYGDDNTEFGEFQGASTEFITVDLATPSIYEQTQLREESNAYSYYSNVIVPPYPPSYNNSTCNPYNAYTTYNAYNGYNGYNGYDGYNSNACNSYNPFDRIMNLRGENEDVHFRFGSQVPSTPTTTTTTWAPELINELKFRLAQPNAGLTPSTTPNYFL